MTFFDIHNAMNAALYHAFNSLSDAYFVANLPLRKAVGRNALFRNRHEGQSCFILGTGPSLGLLRNDQVQWLAHRKTFGVNYFYKTRDLSPISPSYYVLVDNNFWGSASDTFAKITRFYRDRPPIFITDYRARRFVPADQEQLLVFAKNYPTARMRWNLAGNISIGMNVVSTAIISAIYMGFKRIFLLGCDYNMFCQASQRHSYDELDEPIGQGRDLASCLAEYALTTKFHYILQETANEVGVEIVNLTPRSLLDAYPRGDIGELIERWSMR